jgi:hypothetical protein
LRRARRHRWTGEREGREGVRLVPTLDGKEFEEEVCLHGHTTVTFGVFYNYCRNS